MSQYDLFLGVLEEGVYLKIDSEKLFLTKISMEMAQSPESAPLDVASKDLGKMALIRGTKSGSVIYSSSIVEVLSPVTSILVRALVEKGVLNLDDREKGLPGAGVDKEEPSVKKKLCALVIGHKKRSPGAVNENENLTEFDFNDDLSLRIEKRVRKTDIQRVYRRTYSELPGDINALEPDFAVSLHCNAYNRKASGTEVLYYHASEKGKRMAEVVLKHLVDYLGLPNRGIKPKTSEDRGRYLLRYTNAPCVIAELFFIDNDSDLAVALRSKDDLAEAYAKAIEEISEIVV